MSDNASRAMSLEGGALGGPVIVLLGYVIGGRLGIVWSDPLLLALLGLPILVAAPFLLLPRRRADAVRFIVGSLLGIAILVVVVVGGISLVTNMLSDPA
ncbi:hypothetical protein [Nocardioides sp. Soil796]|uniref:hypothetical protein n=1 Tax=Nocardioides sp. Soil796 TaxID=1736412 RepID=UPI00070FF6E5|nr:hypothetical protein [Nocardioides sp. Soil796]KRF15844.1 hypothetical protein ASH02_04275 [Nocardioides sp. Soil796]